MKSIYLPIDRRHGIWGVAAVDLVSYLQLRRLSARRSAFRHVGVLESRISTDIWPTVLLSPVIPDRLALFKRYRPS